MLTELDHQRTKQAPVPNATQELQAGVGMTARRRHENGRTYLGRSTEEKRSGRLACVQGDKTLQFFNVWRDRGERSGVRHVRMCR